MRHTASAETRYTVTGLTEARRALKHFESDQKTWAKKMNAAGRIATGFLSFDRRKVHQGFRDMHRASGKLGNTMMTLGRSVAGVGAGMAGLGVAGVYAFTKVMQSTVRYEDSLTKIGALTDTSARQTRRWGDELLDWSGKVGKTPQELAEGLYFIASSGLKGAKAMDALKISSKAAFAGLGDTKTIADYVTSAIGAYGSKVMDATKAVDILTAAVAKGKGEPEEYARGLGMISGTASALDISLGQVVGAVSALSIKLPVADSITALNNVLMASIKPTREGAAALDAVGWSYNELRKSFAERGILPTLQSIDKAFGGNVETMGRVFGNVRSLRGAMLLLKGDYGKTQEIIDAVTDSQGALNDAYEKAGKGTMKKYEKATAGIQSLLIRIGSAALPLVNDLLDELNNRYLKQLSTWVKTHEPEIKRFFGKVGEQLKEWGPPLSKFLGTLLDMGAWLGNHQDFIIGFFKGLFSPIWAVYKVIDWIGKHLHLWGSEPLDTSTPGGKGFQSGKHTYRHTTSASHDQKTHASGARERTGDPGGRSGPAPLARLTGQTDRLPFSTDLGKRPSNGFAAGVWDWSQDMMKKAVELYMSRLGGFVASVGGKVAGLIGGGGYSWASDLAKRFGLSVTSTYRPGAITAAGYPSDHGVYGRAADIAGSPSAMARLWAAVKHASWLKQGLYRHEISNYGKVSYYGRNDHLDHVHVARQFTPSRGSGKVGDPSTGGIGTLVVPIYLSGREIARYVIDLTEQQARLIARTRGLPT